MYVQNLQQHYKFNRDDTKCHFVIIKNVISSFKLFQWGNLFRKTSIMRVYGGMETQFLGCTLAQLREIWINYIFTSE